ncbi:MAG: VOC family protein [Paracoccaceae bacterium]
MEISGITFVGIQTEDIDGAHSFYHETLGLPVMQRRPDAVVFDTKPIPFAVRKPLMDLNAAQGNLGAGVALWFSSKDADAAHEEMQALSIPVVYPPKDGPFGRHFAFSDPFGYTITVYSA